MIHASWLYYTKKESTQKLTSKETGQIDVSAYLNGQPKFFIDSESAQKIPKKIIIGDLDLKQLTPTDVLKFFFVLNELCRTGFEIYLPKEGYLEYISFFQFMIEGKDQIKQAKEVNISFEPPPSEQYFTLDTDKAHELAQLFHAINPDIPYEKKLLFHFLNSCFNQETDDSDDEEEDWDEGLSDVLNERIKNPIEYYEQMPHETLDDPQALFVLPVIEIKQSESRETLETYFSKKGVIKIHADCNQSEENFKLLERLILLHPITSLQLKLDEPSLLRLRGHQHLKEIVVSGEDIANNFLLNIPQKLNKLIISGILLPEELSETQINVSYLELEYVNVSTADTIIKLINSTQHLHHLKLSINLDSNFIPQIPLNTLAHLRYLKMSKINIHLVDEIISHAPNLEYLEMKVLPDSRFFLLSKLKTANLYIEGEQEYPGSLGIFNIHQFLSNTPNIEQLVIDGHRYAFLPSEEELILSHLKSIKIIGTILIPLQIEYLLRIAPNLEILEIPYLPDDVVIPKKIKIIEYSGWLKDRLASGTPSPQAPEHRAEDMQKPREQSSALDTVQDTYDQGMMIQKFQRYAREFKDTPDEILSSLKNGICFSLSEYFHDFGPDEIMKFLKIARGWNDSTPIPDKLREYFEKLYPIVDAYYIRKRNARFTHQFIGENLQDVLTKSDKILLSNPWHTIAIQKQGPQWCFFDPNHPNGSIVCPNTEELIKSIQRSLGTIIYISTLTPEKYIDCQTAIQNISLFIKHGGFLSLRTLNEAQRIQVISAIQNKTITEIDLSDGLSYYSSAQKAVWELIDLSYCRLILNQYHQRHCEPELAKILDKMQQRIEREQKETVIASMNEKVHPSEAERIKQENIRAFEIYEQKVQPIEHFYSSISKELTTWERTEKETPQETRHFIFHLLQEEKTLVRIHDAATVLDLRNGIQRIATHPVYYVDKAEDLQIIMKRFQVNTDGSVSIQEGSPLSDFLQSTGSPKTILINYDHFSTEEIIQFNEILDKEPKINGIPLPEGIRIIGLQNTAREDAYQESDFYSRFTHIRDFSSDASEFREVFSIQAYEEDSTSSIELYNDPAWKAILFGQLRINGREFIFIPGEFNSGELPPTLILKNAPVDDPEFIEFWRQAIITGKINLYGKEFIIPKDFQLKHLSGYDLETLSRQLSDDDTAPPPQHVLNSQNLHLFLGGQIIQNGEIIYQEGLIEKGQALSILLTEALSEGQWAKLLQACTTTPIQIQSLADINIPDALKARIKPYTPELSMTVVQTNDVEQYLHQYRPNGLIVDVSDFDTAEVFGFTKALLQTDRTYRFESRDSWLIEKLQRGEKVILKGHFSERIIQGIAQHILLKPEWGEHLTLIGDVGSALKQLSSKEPILFEAPRELSEAQAHSLTLLTNPELRLSVKDESAEEFTHERMETIQKALESNPFVFITGLSGCGKTTFIKKHFNPYLEKQGIDKWLKSDSDPRYLFFDETNLSHENWLMFEGLLQTPAFIIFEGQYREVPHTHKVIFAGNPVTYGDERKIPKLFSRHPNVIVFDPMPPKALKEEILLPLFENTEQQGQADEICRVIIQLYEVILSYSTDKVLISPRELQSIAMLSIANAGAQDPVLLAKHYAYTIGRQIVPAKHLKAFEQAFKVERTLPESDTTNEFLITPSRAQTAQYLRDLLHLRTYRQTHKSHLSDAQKTVGLGGFILEGEPGIGKSELLIEVLHHEFGLCKGSLESHQDHVFYTLPPSISLDERKALLLKAFHEGAVVIVDEMNSGPMLESFLNALLIGATPEGEVAKRPGFTVLATQNPSSRGGRREQSDALLRRMLKFNLENYSKAEIQSILLAKGIEKPLAIVLAGIFEERLRFAKEHGKKPEPSFRDLMRLVDEFKAHHVTLSIRDVQGLNLHLKKLIALGFSSDEMIQVIDCFSPTATSERFEPALFIGFLNELKPSHIDILPAYFEKSISMNELSTEQLEWVVQGIRSNEMKSRILNLCIQHEKLSPVLVEEIFKIPGLSNLLPQSITTTITQWIESGVVLGDLSFVKFILDDPSQFNKLTQISDENFKVWCQRKPIPELEKLIHFCNSPLRAKILSQVINEPVQFHNILNELNKKTEEAIITSFIQHSCLRFNFPNPDKDINLIKILKPASFSAYLNLCGKPSSERRLHQLLSKINEPLVEACLSWYVDKKYQIYDFIFENVLKYPKLIKKIQHFSLEDFLTWRSIELTSNGLPFIKTISHQDYCLSFQALNIKEKTSINFNTFILSLTLLKHLNENEEEIIEWINKIELSDVEEVNLELLSNDFLESLSPPIKSAIFCKLLENEQIKAQFVKGEMDEEHVYKHMLDSPELFKKSFEMLYRLAIKNPDKFSDMLYSKLKESIIEENMKSIILQTDHEFSLKLLSYLFRRDKSAHHFKSENFFKEMHKILKKTESVKEEKKPLHHQKLNDTQEFLIDIINLVNIDKNSIKTEVKNNEDIVNQIIERTEQFVKKHQDPHIYHYVLNFLLIIIPPFMIFKLARQCFYNENVFYNADNDLTRAAKTIKDEIIQPKK